MGELPRWALREILINATGNAAQLEVNTTHDTQHNVAIPPPSPEHLSRLDKGPEMALQPRGPLPLSVRIRG